MAQRASIDVAQQPTRHLLPNGHIGPGMLRGGFAALMTPGPWNCVVNVTDL